MPKKKVVAKRATAKKAKSKTQIKKNTKAAVKKPVKKTKKNTAKKVVKAATVKKAVSNNSDVLPPLDLSSFNAKEFIKKMESAYKVKLPSVYTAFLSGKKFADYRMMEMKGFINGPYFLDFIDENLSNSTELGMNAGIFDMDDCNWSEEYGDFVPLASMWHPDLKDGSKGFLVTNVKKAGTPVLLFDYEGWTLYPVANSFNEFLDNLPSATNDIKKSFRPWEEKEEEDEAIEEKEFKTYWTIQREELDEGAHKDIWENSFDKMKTDLPSAIQDLINLIPEYPNNTFLLRSIVTLNLKSNNKKAAMEYIEKGLKIKPNCLFLLKDLANQKIVAGDLESALKIADQIETDLPTTDDDKDSCESGINAIRGMVYYKQGKNKEAFRLLSEAKSKSFLVSITFDGFKEALGILREE